jgi:uncharacterized repeat protein (TIGR03803 family)
VADSALGAKLWVARMAGGRKRAGPLMRMKSISPLDGAAPLITTTSMSAQKNQLFGKVNRFHWLAIGCLLIGLCLPLQSKAQLYGESVLYSFTGGGDGAHPYGGMVEDAQGNLYGTTIQGGAHQYGVLFKLQTNGSEVVVHNFPSNGGEAALPTNLAMDGQGNMYGTTYGGGKYSQGSVFEVNSSGRFSAVYSFPGGGSGKEPQSGLLVNAAGNIYGTTEQGGNVSSCDSAGCGVVFEIDTHHQESELYVFTGTDGDGYWPTADSLVQDAHGNLYGTTFEGGAFGYGTVFKLEPSGKETVLHSFSETQGDGAHPYSGVVLDANGNLYGTTTWGGTYGYGMVYKLTPTGKETVLHSFAGEPDDGSDPQGALVLDPQGTLFGTTGGGGSFSAGTVFQLSVKGDEAVLYNFGSNAADGVFPVAGLLRDAQGDLYGTTVNGGADGFGTVFVLAPGPKLVSIAVGPENATTTIGNTVQYVATGSYSDGSVGNLTSQAAWSSSKTSIATIRSGGIATGVEAGTTKIVADYLGVTGDTALTVTKSSQ